MLISLGIVMAVLLCRNFYDVRVKNGMSDLSDLVRPLALRSLR